MSVKSKFALVRWIEEDSVGVMPTSAAPGTKDLYVGCVTAMKWKKSKKLYDVEILKLSNDHRELNLLVEKLISFELSREDLLNEADMVVSSSTETSPLKETVAPKETPKSSGKPATSRKTTKKPAASLLADDKEILAAAKRAKRLFSDDASTCSASTSATSEGDVSPSPTCKTITPPTMTSVKNVVSNSTFECLNKSVLTMPGHQQQYDQIQSRDLYQQKFHYPQASFIADDIGFSDMSDSTYHSGLPYDSYSYVPPAQSFTYQKSPSFQSYGGYPVGHDPQKTTPPQGERTPETKEFLSHRKVPSPKVELVEGYNVFLTKRELDDAIDTSRNNPTRLIRNLISLFFPREVLANSSALGGRVHKSLDKDIISACLRFVQSQHNVSRTCLIDAINDKCANARRTKSKE